MAKHFDITVRGIPIAKGSAKGFYIPQIKRVVITQTNKKKQTPWVSAIQNAVFEKYGHDIVPTEGGVAIHAIRFYFPRPKAHYRTGKYAGVLKDAAPDIHTVTPDIDKLERCVLDALTGICWRDDSKVYRIAEADKRYIGRPDSFSIVPHLEYAGMSLRFSVGAEHVTANNLETENNP